MKRAIIATLASVCALASSATALAGPVNSDFFVIGKLAASSSASHGFRVYPAGGYSLPDTCPKRDFAEMVTTGPSGFEIDMMARLLTTAFWTGKKVQLRLDGCGHNDRPAYRIVRLDRAQ